jgi:hypothetical protein
MTLTPEHSAPSSKPVPWGVWATLGFSALIIFANLVSVMIAAIGIVASGENPGLATDPAQLASNGMLVALSTLISSPIVLSLTLLFANLRKGLAVKEYLGLHEVGWKTTVRWSVILLLFAGLSDLMTFLLKQPIVPDFMFNVYQTATSKTLLWIALVVAAPVSEEIFFRGFLFYGIQNTRLGPKGAIFLSSLLWTPLHMQYDLYTLAAIMVLGLLLGYARWRGNSVYIPIVMHALMNFIAAMEVMLQIALTPN